MINDRPIAAHAFRLFAGTLGWTAVVVQLVATLRLPTGPSELTRTVNYFSYFTILTNILAAATLTIPELAGQWRVGRVLLNYQLRTALAVYMIVTCSIYAIFLSGASQLTEVQYVADVTLHYVMPPLYLIDWLLIRPERRTDWMSTLYFLIFPFLYGVYTFARGAVIHAYPYPFIDVTTLGYKAVLINCGLFAILFLGLGVVLVAVGRGRAPKPNVATPCGAETPK